eukprot:symbB.v1.2.039526.t1/scaffold6626.1/size16615/2
MNSMPREKALELARVLKRSEQVNVSSEPAEILSSRSLNESLGSQLVTKSIISMQNMSPIPEPLGVSEVGDKTIMRMVANQQEAQQTKNPREQKADASLGPIRKLRQEQEDNRRISSQLGDDKVTDEDTDRRKINESVEPAPASGPRNMVTSWLHPSRVRSLCLALTLAILMTITCHMMPGAHHTSTRLPPRWEPGLEDSLPFRTWLQDLLLWTITSDLEPHRQAALIISQLGGAARELARTMTPQEIFQGGIVNGQQLDPVSFLIHGLSTRFSPLDDEIRIRAAQDLLHFQRRGNEAVDVLITRFETIRARARTEGGGANISTESAALILLRAVGVSAEQFQRLTQPFGLRLPNNEAEFAQLTHNLRRMGHIIEHHPANIARSLHGTSSNQHQSLATFQDPSSQASSWSFVGYPSEQEGWGNRDAASSSQNMHSSSTYPTDWAYYQDPEADGASDTDSATESDDGAEVMPSEDLQGLTAPEADEHLFWQYAEAKKRWRRYTGKPVRSLRRVLRRKGKGKGKVQNAFFDISGTLLQSSYFKGKGKGGKSSGKGFGRRQNPKGRDGQILKCSICSSIYHLRKRCPQNPEAQRGRVQSSGPQSSQLPYPQRSTAPSVAGFATENDVTNSDGQVGPASMHFATSTHESFEDADPVVTPRRHPTAEEHALTPDDPWMQWHQDPWSGGRTSHVPQQLPGIGVGIPGVWPPPITGGFPSSAMPGSFQTMHQRPEVGPSLMPSSEMQAMTTMFSTLPQFHGEEEPSTSERPRSSPFVEAFVHDTFVPQPMHYQSPAVFVPSSFPPEAFVPHADVTAFGQSDSTAPNTNMLSGMFSQVHQLRQTQGEQWAHEAVRTASQAGLRPRIQDKASPLEVGGVGKGTQKCFKELLIPTALRSSDGSVNGGTYTAPMIPKSACPALLGLKSLMSHRAVLDLATNRLILMPEGSEVEVPPGAEVLPLEQAETGHLLLPIDDYNRMIQAKDEGRNQKQRHMFADALCPPNRK